MRRWLERRRAAPGPAEIENALECACKDRSPAVVLLREQGDVLRARFERLERNRVTLVLDPGAAAAAPRPLSVCCISFAHDERVHVFLAPIWRVTSDPSEAQQRLLSVGLPGQLATLDVGSARRIPIDVGMTFGSVIGTYDRRSWAPEAVDLSATGILLDFGREKPPRLPVGALVEIALEFEGERATLTAAVRRREGARLGLSFVDAAHGASITPPPALAVILGRLEERWLETSSD
jgi:hypothetical protein